MFGTYITGYTYSTNFPGAPPRIGVNPNDADVFVTMLGNDGQIIWSVVLGGSGFDMPTAIATAPIGRVYIAGRTSSTNFPTTNALQSAASGNGDAFVFMLDFDGSVGYSTYLERQRLRCCRSHRGHHEHHGSSNRWDYVLDQFSRGAGHGTSQHRRVRFATRSARESRNSFKISSRFRHREPLRGRHRSAQ
jgi:hypothetical protein